MAAWEREEFAKLPFDEEAYREELGVPELFGEEGYTTRERTWARPTCDVNGIFGGYMGKGAKTVLPSWGGAKVSMRLVPDQEPGKIAELFTSYVQSVAPKGVTVEVTNLHGADPVVVEAEGPIVDAAMDAMEEVWGARPVRIREGGSIPIVSTFSSVLSARSCCWASGCTTTACTRRTRSSTSVTSTTGSDPWRGCWIAWAIYEE